MRAQNPLPLLTIKQASKLFGIAEWTLRTYIRDRKIPYYKGKFGTRSMIRISQKDLEDLFTRIPSGEELFR